MKTLATVGIATAAVAGLGQVYHYFDKPEKRHDDYKKRSIESSSQEYDEVVMSARSPDKTNKITEAPANAKADLKSTDFPQKVIVNDNRYTLPGHTVTPPAPYVQNPLAIVPYKGPATPSPAASAAVAQKGMSTMKKTAGIAAGIAAVAGAGTLIAGLVKSHNNKKHRNDAATAAKRALDESEVQQRLFKRAPLPIIEEEETNLMEKRTETATVAAAVKKGGMTKKGKFAVGAVAAAGLFGAYKLLKGSKATPAPAVEGEAPMVKRDPPNLDSVTGAIVPYKSNPIS
jgi:hypothetical protein